MARRADKVRVYPFEFESCIAIVIEPVGGPALARAVTALAVLLLVLLELAAMHVPMACITGRRRAPVHARHPGRVAGRVGPLPAMTIHAVGLLVSACQWIAGLAGMIVGPDAERGGIRSMTSRAVAFCHLALELSGVAICVALLAFARRGDEATDRRVLKQDMATDTRNR